MDNSEAKLAQAQAAFAKSVKYAEMILSEWNSDNNSQWSRLHQSMHQAAVRRRFEAELCPLVGGVKDMRSGEPYKASDAEPFPIVPIAEQYADINRAMMALRNA